MAGPDHRSAAVAPQGAHGIDPAYPRPHFARRRWLSLDGPWDFAGDPAQHPDDVAWNGRIVVPFAPQAAASNAGLREVPRVVWYRRLVAAPREWSGQRVLLHFGAVDWRANVWIDGHLAGTHEGGHTPFTIDATPFLSGGGEHQVAVRAEDDPAAFDQPRGKQDWRDEPHSIWYPRTTGIWQSVWLEPVAEAHVRRVRLTPDVPSFSLAVAADLALPAGAEAELEIEVLHEDRVVARDRLLAAPKVSRRIDLPDPGIEDARQPWLWSPEHPNLLDVRLTLHVGGEPADEVATYVGLRTVEARGDRFHLNGRPYFLRMVLDQGYWPDTLMTPPDAAALRRDVELAREMGFNGVRKHQKLEDPRYLYWADRLGLLVWTELPSAYAFTSDAAVRLTREWLEAIERDVNHPCVVAWVGMNESWGVPDLPASPAQRDFVRSLYRLAKSLDPTRPVVDNDGWEHIDTDLFTVHDYASDPAELARRYGDAHADADADVTHLRERLARLRPAGRALQLEGDIPHAPVILSEFGGIRYHSGAAADGWGYHEATSPEDLLERYAALVAAASSRALAGFCYTQFADTFQEQNGLLNADRSPKLPLAELARATRGEGETPPTHSA